MGDYLLVAPAILRRMPASDIMVYPMPNYIDPPTYVPLIWGTGIGFGVVTLLFIAARLFSRLWIIKTLMLEDYMICVSWLLSVFLTFCCIWSTKYGVGLHVWDVPWEMTVNIPAFPPQYVMTIIYPLALTTIKASIIIFYLRLTPSDTFRKACMWTMALIVAICVSQLFPLIFACKPIDAMWKPLEQLYGGAKCINYVAVWIYAAAANVVSDLILFVLPIPMIWRSQMRWEKKRRSLVLFGLGIFLLVASIVRLQMNTEALDFNIVVDYNWHGARAMAWTLGEVNVGILIACLPGISPLLARIFPRLFGSSPSASPGQVTPENGQFVEMESDQRRKVFIEDILGQEPPGKLSFSEGPGARIVIKNGSKERIYAREDSELER